MASFSNFQIQDSLNLSWHNLDESEAYTARHENSLVQAGDKFYLMGGRENARTIDVYDYKSNEWTALENNAPKSFNHFQATVYGGLIWVIGAFNTNDYPNEIPEQYIWAFDPTTLKWTKGPEIPGERRRGAAGPVVFKDNFYVLAGNTKGHNGGFVPWLDSYNPATGEWKILENAPRSRDHFFGVVIENNLYAAGGRLSGGQGGTFIPTIAEVDVYDLERNTWRTLPSNQNIPTPRAGAPTVNFRNHLVVIGGEVKEQEVYGLTRTDALEITEAYDPRSQEWSRWPDLNHKRHGTQAIVSGDGIFVLSGSTNLGGGRQHNLEALGSKKPEGKALISSRPKTPKKIRAKGRTKLKIPITLDKGNVGKFIVKIDFFGIGASDFRSEHDYCDRPIFIKPYTTLHIPILYLGSKKIKPATAKILFSDKTVAEVLIK
ncbi:Kelch repeat-containing protein [Croceitalea marina]|uniref:Kelch repeat-containing protein n=1 Tax=Croceitalea marina TaxID=1775166 RepID=A0ABW5MUF1_9FLAO